MAAPTWREVADRLAAQLAPHAACEDHPESSAQPDVCPSCADRAVLRLWQRKNRAHPLRHDLAERV